jgi:glycosyltransferase involved in cell wall biosynthesis
LVESWAIYAEVHHLELGQIAGADLPAHCYLSDLQERFTFHTLRNLISRLHPDIVFLFGDLYWSGRASAAAHDAGSGSIVAYCPIDTEIDESLPLPDLTALDCLVLYTPFARTAVRAAFQNWCQSPPAIEIIPHGLDPRRFNPWPGTDPERRASARALLFPDRPELAEAFIVLNANRNQPRKRLDLTIAAFADFSRRAHERPAYLLLHTGLRDQGFQLLPLAHRAGIAERVLFLSFGLAHPRVSDERLNAIYNACDLGLNTAQGEGWGLVSFEHAATRAAQIVPRHSSCQDLWEGAALFVDAQRVVRPETGPVYEVNIASISHQIDSLYRNPIKATEWAVKAYERSRANLSWVEVASAFMNLFERVVVSRHSA